VFIAIEGLDGSGGTTQVSRLATLVQNRGREVVQTREPTAGPIGKLIRRALSPGMPEAVIGDSVLPYLFAGDRRDHLDRVVLPALTRGAVVITDRYVPSSLAYQGVAIGVGEALALNASFPAPDLTIVLDVPPDECMRRILARGAPRERFEDTERLQRVRAAYADGLALLEQRGDRIISVDGTLSIDALSECVWEHAGPLI
jgi:dTMP kinase